MVDTYEDMNYIISIHAAREGGDGIKVPSTHPLDISIHAAREGGDLLHDAKHGDFYISIHAAREGGDCTHFRTAVLWHDFNPRRP